MARAAFIAGDWGTTHLRLFLCDRNGHVLEAKVGPGRERRARPGRRHVRPRPGQKLGRRPRPAARRVCCAAWSDPPSAGAKSPTLRLPGTARGDRAQRAAFRRGGDGADRDIALRPLLPQPASGAGHDPRRGNADPRRHCECAPMLATGRHFLPMHARHAHQRGVAEGRSCGAFPHRRDGRVVRYPPQPQRPRERGQDVGGSWAGSNSPAPSIRPRCIPTPS